VELPVIDPADVRRVQCGGVDHDVRPLNRGAAHPAIAQVADDAGPFARQTIDPANGPAIGVQGRRDRRTDQAGTPGDRRDAYR
jgi:hypothetical protein